MRYIVVSLVSLLIFGCAGIKDRDPKPDKARQTDSLTEFCKTASCRQDVDIRLKKEDGSYFEFKSKLSPPVVQGDLISIYANEKIFVEAEVGENGPVNLKHVTEIAKPERTIVFEFKQDVDRDQGYSMVLITYNPFQKALRYKLGIMPLGADEFYAASSCPVNAKGNVYEHWPFPAFQLMVVEMKFIEKGKDDFSCKE